jgi:hypothetical protein
MSDTKTITDVGLSCGRDFSSFPVTVSQLSDSITLLSSLANSTLYLTSCERIVPLYTRAVYDDACTYMPTSVFWVFSSSVVLSVMGLIMITTRASYKLTEYSGSKHPESESDDSINVIIVGDEWSDADDCNLQPRTNASLRNHSSAVISNVEFLSVQDRGNCDNQEVEVTFESSVSPSPSTPTMLDPIFAEDHQDTLHQYDLPLGYDVYVDLESPPAGSSSMSSYMREHSDELSDSCCDDTTGGIATIEPGRIVPRNQSTTTHPPPFNHACVNKGSVTTSLTTTVSSSLDGEYFQADAEDRQIWSAAVGL